MEISVVNLDNKWHTTNYRSTSGLSKSQQC